MSWKKYFKEAPNAVDVEKYLNNANQNPNAVRNNQSSYLYEIYAGPANRLERYNQYDIMDSDSLIAAALDTLAEFCVQKEDRSKEFFEFNFKDDASGPETDVLMSKMREWVEINDLDKRLFGLMRSVLKYGDVVFVRDPETYELIWIDPHNVERVVVNESKGKVPEEYWIRNPDLNLQTLVGSLNGYTSTNSFPTGFLAKQAPRAGAGGASNLVSAGGAQDSMSIPIPAEHIVHFSLTNGMDINWPFGNSILEQVYKAYKQKELLEDAILIYRVHRAPERRVFYVDVGNMPSHKIMAYLERVKNEINQRRIPTKTGGNQSIMDATFNPMSMTEDFFFPQNADGRGSRVDTLPGGEGLGQINDLDYFNNTLKLGLQIPPAYLPGASSDDSAVYNDGRATTALISEYRFSKYCERLQSFVNDTFDLEFKLYLKSEGVEIDSSLFQLGLNVPQNFARYRQIELDNSRISTWQSIVETPYISKRFALERWLGLTEEEVVKNEEMWKEENAKKLDSEGSGDGSGAVDDLGSLGIRPDTGVDEFEEFDEFGDDMDMDDGNESPISGDTDSDIPPPPPAQA